VSEDAVMWNDGSLGCPQPGLSLERTLVYVQVLTPVPGTTGALLTPNPSLLERTLRSAL